MAREAIIRLGGRACQTILFSEQLSVGSPTFDEKKLLRERILTILGYLSQSLLENRDLFYEAQEIWDELHGRGFTEEDIEGAIGHIEKTQLELPGRFWNDSMPVCRTFSNEESTRLSSQARGYLWKLKCRGIIDHAIEDEIVHKAMNLEEPAGLREIKTVAALTVFGYEHRVQGRVAHQSYVDTRLN